MATKYGTPAIYGDDPIAALANSRRFQTTGDIDLIRYGVGLLSHRDHIEVVDLGAGAGTSAGAAISARLPQSIHLTQFDINEDHLYWSRVFLDNLGWSHLTHQVARDSVKAADFTRDLPGEHIIDFLMVDTSHEYMHTLAEIIAWQGLCEGYVWFDDYSEEYDGVRMAVDKACRDGIIDVARQSGKSILCRWLDVPL